jgi:hypothetical protein
VTPTTLTGPARFASMTKDDILATLRLREDFVRLEKMLAIRHGASAAADAALLCVVAYQIGALDAFAEDRR